MIKKLNKDSKKISQYCKCNNPIIATKSGVFGYQEYCAKCKKDIEDGFHYYDEPNLYN